MVEYVWYVGNTAALDYACGIGNTAAVKYACDVGNATELVTGCLVCLLLTAARGMLSLLCKGTEARQ